MNGMPDFTVDFADLFRNFLDLLVCPKGHGGICPARVRI